MDEIKLKEVLESCGVSDWRYFPTIGSTNDEALHWTDNNAPDFALVIADEQTKGKGRFSRRWVTKAGSSLAFSLILHPDDAARKSLPLFAPLCGLAVRDALAAKLGLNAQIKWPNDLLIERKKCCGILVEAVWTADSLKGIVLGIGINITHDSLPPNENSLFPAACLEDAAQQVVDRLQVLAGVLRKIAEWRPLIGSQQFFDTWTEHLAFKGEEVMIVQTEKQSIIGIEKGIDHEGNLVIQTADKGEMTFEVGDVHLRPAVNPD